VNAKDELTGADIKALCTEVYYLNKGRIIGSERKKNEDNLRRSKASQRKSSLFEKKEYSRRSLFVIY